MPNADDLFKSTVDRIWALGNKDGIQKAIKIMGESHSGIFHVQQTVSIRDSFAVSLYTSSPRPRYLWVNGW